MKYTVQKLFLAILFLIANQIPLSAQTKPVYHEIAKVYIVNTAEELLWVADTTNNGCDFTGQTIVLTDDIDLSGLNPWTPIGNSVRNPFNGSFDGNGKEISGITINSGEHAGLFGYIQQDGVIKNTGVSKLSIILTSAGALGGIAGTTNGVITNCYCLDANISSTAPYSNVGGIAGKVDTQGSIDNCYLGGIGMTSVITNTDNGNGRDKTNHWHAGGIAGYSTGNIINNTVFNSTITGRNKGDLSKIDYIIGENINPGIYNNNTYQNDTKLNGINYNYNNLYSAGTTTAQEAYVLLNLNIENNYKYGNLFNWNSSNIFDYNSNGVDFNYGNGTSENPFLITSYSDLKLISTKTNASTNSLNEFFELWTNISCPTSETWIPIGKSEDNPFRGHFDGNDFQIKKIRVIEFEQFSGLFGYTENATIKNIRINSALIIAKSELSAYAGAVSGYSYSTTIQNIIVDGTTTIDASPNAPYTHCSAGRICGGYNGNPIFKNNYSTKEVTYSPYSSEEGHYTKNGESIDSNFTISDLSTTFENELNIRTDGNVFLLRSNNTLDVIASNRGNVICMGNTINNLTVETGSSQKGLLNTQNVYLMDGSKISEQGIENKNEIIYYRNFSTYAQKGCQGGWETICLPFNSELYANDENKNPVLASTSGQYWLRKHVEAPNADNESVAFASLREFSAIEANTPYIIALPGDKYGSLSLMDKEITFRGTGNIQPFRSKNPQSNVNAGNYTFEGSYHGMEKTPSVRFLLNNHTDGTGNGVEDTETLMAGHSFIQTTSDVNQYRAYFIEKNSSASAPTMLKIVTGVDTPNDMMLSFEEKSSLKIVSKGGVLIIEAKDNISLPLFNAVSGSMVKLLRLNAGENHITDIPAGAYILNGQKLIH